MKIISLFFAENESACTDTAVVGSGVQKTKNAQTPNIAFTKVHKFDSE